MLGNSLVCDVGQEALALGHHQFALLDGWHAREELLTAPVLLCQKLQTPDLFTLALDKDLIVHHILLIPAIATIDRGTHAHPVIHVGWLLMPFVLGWERLIRLFSELAVTYLTLVRLLSVIL